MGEAFILVLAVWVRGTASASDLQQILLNSPESGTRCRVFLGAPTFPPPPGPPQSCPSLGGKGVVCKAQVASFMSAACKNPCQTRHQAPRPYLVLLAPLRLAQGMGKLHLSSLYLSFILLNFSYTHPSPFPLFSPSQVISGGDQFYFKPPQGQS